MEENTTVTQEQGMEETAPDQVQETDGFLEGWDEDALTSDREEPADQPEPAEEEQAVAQQSAQPEQESVEQAADQPEAVQPALPSSWEITYMGQKETVTAEQITPELLQKARDYDRVRSAYDETRPMMDLFSAFANKAGMNTKDYIAHLRAQAKQSEGMNEAEARRAVELEDREAAIAVKEEAEAQRRQAAEQANAAQKSAEARREADIAEFKRTFPDAAKDPKAIPPQVWDEVRNGSSLVAAYGRYALDQERAARLAAEGKATVEAKNQNNAARSTGSMQSAGGEIKSRDPFLEGWDS